VTAASNVIFRNLIYKWTWSAVGNLNTEKIRMGIGSATYNDDQTVTWTCSYSQSFTLSSDGDAGTHGARTSTISGTGNYADSFSIGLHRFHDRVSPLNDRTQIGSSVFVRVSQAVGRTKFYLKHCIVKEGSQSIALIKNNCYAGGLGVSLIGEHLQAHFALFNFRIFTFSAGNGFTQSLECTVTMCPDAVPCSININEHRCPRGGLDTALLFSLHGRATRYSHPEPDEEEGSGDVPVTF